MSRVLLVDDHDLIRQGLRKAFERDGAFEVVGEAASVSAGIGLAEQLTPDISVVDINLADGNGLDVVRHLRKHHPTMGLVVLTMYDDDTHLFAAMEAGASAFVPKSVSTDQVLAAARHAASAPSSFSAAGLAEAVQRRRNDTGPRLNARESELLKLLGDGLSVSLIARRMTLSESTVKSHMSKLYDKLGAGNRSQALMAAVRLNLLQAPRV